MKNIIQYIAPLLVLFLFSHQIHAQDDDPNLFNYEVNENMFLQANYTSVSSPEAASLGKFGDYNVNTFTGGLSLNIPLFNFSTRSLNYGLSLSYDGTGNKVEVLPSWSGLGWSLLGVPVITRTVKGQPDTKNNYYSKGSAIFQHSKLGPGLSEVYEFYKDVEEQLIDPQSDEFNLTFPGGNVKFYVMYDGEVVLAEQQDIDITVSLPFGGDDGINHFTVKDANGNIYQFTEVEKTKIVSDEVVGIQLVNQEYNSAYYCRLIVSAVNSDALVFTYDSKDDYEYYYDLNPEKNISKKYSMDPLANCSKCKDEATYILSPTIQITKGRKFLDEVEYRINSETVEKIKINSSEHSAQYKKPFDRRIHNIQVYKGDMTTPQYEIDFDMDTEDRLRLTQIQKVGHDGIKSDRYSFTYDETPLPEPSSSKIDAWGYYNNNYTSSLIPTVNNYGEGANREPNEGRSQAGILKTITYPTGGYTEFDYKLNRGRFGTNSEFKNVGGLRIQSVNTFEADESLILRKNYVYADAQDEENGVLYYNIEFQREEIFYYKASDSWIVCSTGELDPCCEYTCAFKKNSTHNTATIAAFKSTHIGYPRIEEHLYDAEGSLGKNVFHYEVNHSDIKLFPNLRFTEVYNAAGNKISETENIYLGKEDPENYDYYSYAITPRELQNNFYYIINNNCTNDDISCWSQNIDDATGPAYQTKYEHINNAINIRTYQNFLEKSIRRTFFESGAIVNKVIEYDYDVPDFRNNQPERITVTDGNDYSRTIEFTYPYASNEEIASNMIEKHILHTQMEVIVDDGTSNGVQTKYGFREGRIAPVTFNQLREDGTWKFKASIDEYTTAHFPKIINRNTLKQPVEYTYYGSSKSGLLNEMTYGDRITNYTFSNFRELESIEDYNNIASTFLYDGVGRLKTSNTQNGRIETTLFYNQAHSNGGENILTSLVNYKLDSNIPTLRYESIFDGIGRKLEDRKLGFTQSGSDYISSSIYNGLNSVIFSTDPSTGGITKNVFEASPLQRMENSTPPGSPSPIATIYGTNTENYRRICSQYAV